MLADAEFVLALCDRFHKLPSEIYAEDSDLVKMINVVALATPKDKEGTDGG